MQYVMELFRSTPRRARTLLPSRRRSLKLIVVLAAVAAAYAGWRLTPTTSVGAQSGPPPGASVSVRVSVPASMRSSPFNVDRYLNVPPNFSIAVYARVAGARFMAVAPNGDLLVSRPGTGSVYLVRANAGGDPSVTTFVSGLRNPHDVVFHPIGNITYVYIAESHQINRYIYNYGDATAHDRQIVISGLPDNSSPELQGSYGHQLKNIALDSAHKLYVSIASATNASVSDTISDPVRCAIYQYNADGSGRRLFARGLRNAEGLAILPGTNQLWVAVNNRDNIGFPFHQDWDGDGSDDYGKVMPSYVDNHPPEEFTSVRDGGNYGWPFANPNPDTANGLDDMPFDLDVQNNADGRYGSVDSFDRITKGIQAHSAPLGLSFLQNTAFPDAYRQGVVLGLHGSWNRTVKTGYKVIYFPWETATQRPGEQIDLVSGWVSGNSDWGRPVDAVADLQGNLLISDDASGTIYKLTYNQAPPTPTPVPTATPIPTPVPTPVAPSAYYELVARHSGKCLDVPAASQSNGAALIQYTCHGGANQQWQLQETGGGYYRITARHSGKAMDVSGVSNNNGAAVHQWDYWGGANQQWSLQPVGGGYYRIVARHSGKALDVAGNSQANLAELIQWTVHGGANQQWLLRPRP